MAMLQPTGYSGQSNDGGVSFAAGENRSIESCHDKIAQSTGIAKMKRDVDLQRLILLFLEEHIPPRGGLDRRVEIPEYDRATVNAHLELLIESGFVDGRISKGLGPAGMDIVVIKLTSSGHDAIAAARNDTSWQKAKKTATEGGVSLTLGVLVEILKAEARKHLGLL
jgi:hypothetical protein